MSQIELNQVAQHYKRLAEYHQQEALSLASLVENLSSELVSAHQTVKLLEQALQQKSAESETPIDAEAVIDTFEGLDETLKVLAKKPKEAASKPN